MTDEVKDAPSVSAVPAVPKRKRTRIVGLDGLRGIGCIAVVVGHTSGFYSPTPHKEGMLGMLGLFLIMFFVLSGFLLFLPYVHRLTAEPSKLRLPSTSEYGLHRVMRVFPAYLVIFLLCNFVFHAVYVQNPATVAKGTDAGAGTITDPGQLLANLTLLQTYFPQYMQTGINPAWSLSLELAFYLSLPLLGMMLFALRKRVNVNPMLLACLAPTILLVIGFAGRLAAPLVVDATGETDFMLQNWGPNWASVFLRSYLTNADIFAYGMLAAILFVAIERGVLSERSGRRAFRISLFAFIPATLIAVYLAASQNLYATSAVGVFSAIVMISLILPLAWGREWKFAQWMDNKAFYFLGLISLSVYLWHYPVLVLLGRYGFAAGDSWPGLLRNVAVMIGVVVVVSTITYYLVELPAQSLAKRYRRS